MCSLTGRGWNRRTRRFAGWQRNSPGKAVFRWKPRSWSSAYRTWATPQATGLPSLKLRQNIEWVERETIRRALESAGGVKKDAAELMGISQRALSYYLAKYRID